MNPLTSSEQDSTTDAGAKPSDVIRVISSMAPRLILEQLLAEFSAESGIKTDLTAMGGVDAAERVKIDNTIDLVVLSKNAISTLSQSDYLYSDTQDIALSEVAVAVKSGTHQPDLKDEEAVKKALINAKSIAYSTGPSGQALADLFQRWGISDEIAKRLVCPPPGIPVGSLLAAGKAELGFQQRSELIHVEGIDILGPLPDSIQIKTVFSAGVCLNTSKLAAAHKLISYLSSSKADAAIQQQGMLAL